MDILNISHQLIIVKSKPIIVLINTQNGLLAGTMKNAHCKILKLREGDCIVDSSQEEEIGSYDDDDNMI